MNSTKDSPVGERPKFSPCVKADGNADRLTIEYPPRLSLQPDPTGSVIVQARIRPPQLSSAQFTDTGAQVQGRSSVAFDGKVVHIRRSFPSKHLYNWSSQRLTCRIVSISFKMQQKNSARRSESKIHYLGASTRGPVELAFDIFFTTTSPLRSGDG